MSGKISFISAGAGSGKTYRITEYLYEQLVSQAARPEAVIATTFTKKAASELIERVRGNLTEGGRHDLSDSMGQALIGTVNSVCGRILGRYAFEAGLSPDLEVLDDNGGAILFSQALEQVVDLEDIRRMNALAKRLGKDSWKDEVKRVTDMARSNNLSAEGLPQQAKASSKELLAFFPKATRRKLDDDLKIVVTKCIRDIGKNDDSTKGTQTYLDFLRTVQREHGRGNMPWSTWVKLSKNKPTKRSLDASEPVRDLALLYDQHPQLHKDIAGWILSIFTLASKTLKTYQLLKAQRGMMDFVDQEQQVLELLQNPEVTDAVTEELDLLLVDEFQDTSPIQLAIFLKLAQLAKTTVWVGDIKQAIYGFRGCDPDLMNAVVSGVKASGGEVEILSDSWRSRPQLVNLVNALFVPAFSEMLSKEEVSLTPQREEKSTQASLEFWNLEGGNHRKISQALAEGILQLFSENHQVVDKNSGKLRSLRYRDVAVLSRTNDKATGYASSIAALGIPASRSQSGLLKTPEVILALACLRRLVDPADTLASAEIIALHGSEDPEVWLEDRLEYLSEGKPSSKWRVEGDNYHPILADLEAERSATALLSPSESINRAILVGEVERAARIWGPNSARGMQRLANLEALRGFATQYEDSCRQQRSAATVSGMVLWLNDLADSELDNMGIDSGADAVQVLTHHGAKGLEWPVVITADLESGLRSRLWGLSQSSQKTAIDMTDPLEGRTLRYWVWPFGKQSAGVTVLADIENSSRGAEDHAQQLAEAKRLLYVSCTRARDLLILPKPCKSKALPWLDTLEADWLQRAGGELSLPDGEKVKCAVRDLTGRDDVVTTKEDKKVTWFPVRKPVSGLLPDSLVPSSYPPVSIASIGRTIILGKRMGLSGAPGMATVGDALHGIFAADLIAPENPERLSVIQKLLMRFGVHSCLDAKEALVRCGQLRKVLEKDFNASNFYPEWPVQMTLENGQRMQGWIDLLVDTPEGWILIDHKSFPGSQKDWEKRALEYSGQLYAYKLAIETATGKTVLSQWIHFSVGGGLVEVGYNKFLGNGIVF